MNGGGKGRLYTVVRCRLSGGEKSAVYLVDGVYMRGANPRPFNPKITNVTTITMKIVDKLINASTVS